MMRHFLKSSTLSAAVVTTLAAGWVLVSAAPIRAQNPITAAKEAFKRARDEQQRQRPAQPVQPGQPAQPAPTVSATAPGAATADCCSPEALSRLASSIGFIDVVGVKLGMTPQEAIAALKANNPKLVIDVHDAELTAGAKQGRRARVILAHLPAQARNPDAWGNLDGSHEAIGVQLTPPPGPLVVEEVLRYVRFADNARVATSNIVDGLRKKYGQESTSDQSSFLAWVFDTHGNRANASGLPALCLRAPNLSLSGGDIRGGGASAPGRVFGSVNELLQFGNDNFNQFTARCVSYVFARAEIQLTTPVAFDFWTSIHSNGLIHNSLALTAAYVKGEVEGQIKQQEDAAGKRAVPKL